jgi:hypothetical protein
MAPVVDPVGIPIERLRFTPLAAVVHQRAAGVLVERVVHPDAEPGLLGRAERQRRRGAGGQLGLTHHVDEGALPGRRDRRHPPLLEQRLPGAGLPSEVMSEHGSGTIRQRLNSGYWGRPGDLARAVDPEGVSADVVVRDPDRLVVVMVGRRLVRDGEARGSQQRVDVRAPLADGVSRRQPISSIDSDAPAARRCDA